MACFISRKSLFVTSRLKNTTKLGRNTGNGNGTVSAKSSHHFFIFPFDIKERNRKKFMYTGCPRVFIKCFQETHQNWKLKTAIGVIYWLNIISNMSHFQLCRKPLLFQIKPQDTHFSRIFFTILQKKKTLNFPSLFKKLLFFNI